MKNNAFINTRLEDLLSIADARANVTIYVTKDGKESLLRDNKIFKIISDECFIGSYGSYEVVGLTVILGVMTILIKEVE